MREKLKLGDLKGKAVYLCDKIKRLHFLSQCYHGQSTGKLQQFSLLLICSSDKDCFESEWPQHTSNPHAKIVWPAARML